MPDDKEKNWLDRIADMVGGAVDDLLEAAYEGIIGIVPEPIQKQVTAPIEAVGKAAGWVMERQPPTVREPIEQAMWGAEKLHELAAEPFAATLLKELGIGGEKTGFQQFMPPMFSPTFPGTPQMEQYRQEVPASIRFAAESIPYFAIPTGTAMRLPWMQRALGAPAKIGAEMPGMALRGARPPVRIPTTPTRTAVMPEGVRVRAGLEGVETAGMPPVKPPRLPPRVPPSVPEPVAPKYRQYKLKEIADFDAALSDQFDFMTGKLTDIAGSAARNLERIGWANPARQLNPTIMAKPHQKATAVYNRLIDSGRSAATDAGQVFRARYGTAVESMGLDAQGYAMNIKGNPVIWDILSWPEKFVLTPAQREFVEAWLNTMGQRATRMQEKNIPMRLLKKIEEPTGEIYGVELTEGRYSPRIPVGFITEEPKAFGIVPKKVRVKPPQLRERGWPTAKQGIEEGRIQYLDPQDPIRTLEKTLEAASKLEADYGLVEYLAKLPGVRTAKGTFITEHTPLIMRRLESIDAQKKIQMARVALSRAKAGGKVPQNTLNAIRAHHPQLADDVVRIMDSTTPRSRALLSSTTKNFNARKTEVLAEAKNIREKYRIARNASAKIREGEGVIREQYAFKDVFFPKKVAEDLTKFLSERGGSLNRFVTYLNQVGMGLQTTIDLGFWTIQGAAFTARHVVAGRPVLVGNTWKKTLEALASKKAYGRLLDDNADIVAKMVKGGSAPLRGYEFTAWMRTGPLSKIPIMREVFGRFANAFDTWGDAARIYSWRALEGGANKRSANALRDLADHTDKLVGVVSSAKLGVSVNRRQLESAWFMYAPRWRRACYSLMVDCTQGGWRGAEARKVIGSLLVAAPTAYAATCVALGQEPNFDPRTGKFMTIKIGNAHVGLGTPYVGLFRLAGNIYKQIEEDPQAFFTFEEGTDHALARFFRSSASIVTGVLWDVTEGKNYIGEEVNREIENVGREAAETLLPFWASEYAQAAVEGQEMPGPELFAGEFMGMRAWPVQAWEERKELRNKLAQEAHGVDWYSPDMLQKDRNALYAGSPELQQLDKEILERKIQTGDPAEIVDDWLRAYIKKWKYDEREALSLQLINGEIDKSQWNWRWAGISSKASGMYEAGELVGGFLDAKGQADYKKWREEHTNIKDKAVNQYYDLEDTASRERYLRSLAPRVRQYVTYMLEEDWKLYLGPNAQKAQQLVGRGGGVPPGGGGFEGWQQQSLAPSGGAITPPSASQEGTPIPQQREPVRQAAMISPPVRQEIKTTEPQLPLQPPLEGATLSTVANYGEAMEAYEKGQWEKHKADLLTWATQNKMLDTLQIPQGVSSAQLAEEQVGQIAAIKSIFETFDEPVVVSSEVYKRLGPETRKRVTEQPQKMSTLSAAGSFLEQVVDSVLKKATQAVFGQQPSPRATQREVTAFLHDDRINELTYNWATYNCFNFTMQLSEAAQKQGLNLRPAFVPSARPSFHWVLWFKDEDGQILYIEPREDRLYDEAALRRVRNPLVILRL